MAIARNLSADKDELRPFGDVLVDVPVLLAVYIECIYV